MYTVQICLISVSIYVKSRVLYFEPILTSVVLPLHFVTGLWKIRREMTRKESLAHSLWLVLAFPGTQQKILRNYISQKFWTMRSLVVLGKVVQDQVYEHHARKLCCTLHAIQQRVIALKQRVNKLQPAVIDTYSV